jgi:hypothetical protein
METSSKKIRGRLVEKTHTIKNIHRGGTKKYVGVPLGKTPL